MRQRWQNVKKIVRLWVELFDKHNLLTYASAIALRTFIAGVACSLFMLGILGATHQERLWRSTIAPEIKPKVLPHVFAGIDQTASRVFSSSTVGLLAFAAALAVWEVSGIVRAAIGALNEIYETPGDSTVLDPVPSLVRARRPLSRGGARSRRHRLGRTRLGCVEHPRPDFALAGCSRPRRVRVRADRALGTGRESTQAVDEPRLRTRRGRLDRPDVDHGRVREVRGRLPYRDREPRGLHLPGDVLLHRRDHLARRDGARRARPRRRTAAARETETAPARRGRGSRFRS